MKRVFAIVMMAALVAAVSLSGAVRAASEENAVKATVTGMNYCIEKALKKAGDDVKIGLDGCRPALKVAEAKDAEGKDVEGLKGCTLHYLFTAAAKDLIANKDMLDKPVTVTGTIYLKERVFEVAEVTVAAAAEKAEGDEANPFGDASGDDPFALFDYSAGGGSASGKKK
ncbi:MAG: hypothetical protein GY851_14235 [bacterium]|nr:hypothetical protein [bacterium]